jgi:hypothetical protein
LTTGIADTGGKFATGVNDTGSKILIILLGHLWIAELAYIYIFAFKFTLRYLQPDINPIVCHRCQRFATGVVDTGGKFGTGINDSFTSVVDTGGKFATGVSDTGGKLPPVSTTPAANLPPVPLTPVANNGINIRLQIP